MAVCRASQQTATNSGKGGAQRQEGLQAKRTRLEPRTVLESKEGVVSLQAGRAAAVGFMFVAVSKEKGVSSDQS